MRILRKTITTVISHYTYLICHTGYQKCEIYYIITLNEKKLHINYETVRYVAESQRLAYKKKNNNNKRLQDNWNFSKLLN